MLSVVILLLLGLLFAVMGGATYMHVPVSASFQITSGAVIHNKHICYSISYRLYFVCIINKYNQIYSKKLQESLHKCHMYYYFSLT